MQCKTVNIHFKMPKIWKQLLQSQFTAWSVIKQYSIFKFYKKYIVKTLILF